MSRIGVIGTGFIVQQALNVIEKQPELEVVKVLTRRPLDSVKGIRRELLTHALDEVLEASDIIFESTGDPIYSTPVVEKALRSDKRVVTMNAELHVTTGSYLAGLGYITEADGDQPGATAMLREEAVRMGFTPIAYVNIKGFLNLNPTREDMIYWSERQQLSLVETTSFTDGTKLQIEQALCANAFGARIAKDGLVGGQVENIFDTDYLVERAAAAGGPISDYVQCATAPPGVFILAEHPVWETLPHYGPYEKLRTKGKQAYLLLRPYHLCGLEVAKSLLRAASGAPPLMSNGLVPRVSVAGLAKRAMTVDTRLHHAIGSFDVRGVAIKSADSPEHVPIGLLAGARIKRPVEVGQMLTFDDVELPESRALNIWLEELRPRFVA